MGARVIALDWREALSPIVVLASRIRHPCPISISPTVAKNLTSVDKSIGIRLHNKRIFMGLSEKQLAEKLLIDTRDINLYETGAKRIGTQLLLRSAIALDVSPVYFFGATDDVGRSPALEERPGENVSFLTLPDQGLRLNRAFASIKNPDVREAIVVLAEKVAAADEAR